MLLFIDSADLNILKQLKDTGLVDGVTTNPSLIAKSGANLLEVIKEICANISGPVSAEVVATDADAMIREGELLAGLASNVVVKVPLTPDGLKATAAFTASGINTNVTLCFSVSQALPGQRARNVQICSISRQKGNIVADVPLYRPSFPVGSEVFSLARRT